MGLYRLCWCSARLGSARLGSAGVSCSGLADFDADAGAVHVIGPALEQPRTCVSGHACTIDGFLGHFLQDGDKLAVLD